MPKIQLDVTNPKTIEMRLVKWDEIKVLTTKASPYLASLIEEAISKRDLPLILASYPYGVDIHLEGQTYYPAPNNTLATLDESVIDNKYKEMLDYSTCPIGLIIDKACEVYIESDEGRSIPFKLFRPGTFFGVWEIMPQSKIQIRKPWTWNISSGARTIFFLPSVNERNSFSRLKIKHNLKSHMPKTVYGQRKVFAEIAQHSTTEWCTKVLFFPKEWLEDDSYALAKLKQYWYKEAWEQAFLWTTNIPFDYSLELFFIELKKRNIKPKPYLVDTIKHLLNIACNIVTGFKPVSNLKDTGPINLIQNSYLNDYHLKYYYPLLFQPDYLLNSFNNSQYSYYSLQLPSLPPKPVEITNFTSTLKMLRELKHTMSAFLHTLKKWPPSNSNFDLIDDITFDYFHSSLDKLDEIQTIDMLFEADATLRPDSISDPKLQPISSQFFRGCVRIKTNHTK